MIQLLHTRNPDNGNTIPVITDTPHGNVTEVSIFRGSVEGNDTALKASVSFDTSIVLTQQGDEHLFEVFLYVLTVGHTATMTDSMDLKSMSSLQKPWDIATVSSGAGDIHAVLVKVLLHAPETF